MRKRMPYAPGVPGAPVMPLDAFRVYKFGKHVDTVFYSSVCRMSADDVRRALIDHDSYPSHITVRCHRRGKGVA